MSGATSTLEAPAEVETRIRATGTRNAVVGALLLLAVVGAVFLSVMIGPSNLSPGEVWASVSAHLGGRESPLSAIRDGIVWELRVPRVLTAAAVGAGLALCGVVLQALTRNPLADPYLLGLSSGASLGAVAVLVLGAAFALVPAAFIGGLAALAASLSIAGISGSISPVRTILAGLAVSAAGTALTSLVIFWSATGDSYREILSWLLGSLAGSDWPTVLISGGALLCIGVPLLASTRVLDAFTLGDTAAAALGVHVNGSRWLLLTATALLTSALVAVSGAIGFVGLILPHIIRLLTGQAHRSLMPLSLLAGALLLVCVDTVARTAFDPRELPVGILTALIGAPVFAITLMKNRVAS